MSLYSPKQWQEMALNTLNASKHLHETNHFRDCVSRAYYAAYQASTAICVQHRDAASFPADWNNPSHEQLPGLIQKNGDLPKKPREEIVKALRFLRSAREDADYKPGRTVDESIAHNCLREAARTFKYLRVKNE